MVFQQQLILSTAKYGTVNLVILVPTDWHIDRHDPSHYIANANYSSLTYNH